MYLGLNFIPALQVVYVYLLGILLVGPAVRLICQGPTYAKDWDKALGNNLECTRTRLQPVAGGAEQSGHTAVSASLGLVGYALGLGAGPSRATLLAGPYTTWVFALQGALG